MTPDDGPRGEPAVQRMRRRPARSAAALIVGAAVLTVVYLLVVIGPHPIDWYRLDAPDLLTVEVTTGPMTWTRVADVSETATSVTVIVKSFDLVLGPGTAQGHPQLSVRLRQPLGSRIVYDGTGQQVPLYHPPEPAPSPSPSAGSEPPLSVTNGAAIAVTVLVSGR